MLRSVNLPDKLVESPEIGVRCTCLITAYLIARGEQWPEPLELLLCKAHPQPGMDRAEDVDMKQGQKRRYRDVDGIKASHSALPRDSYSNWVRERATKHRECDGKNHFSEVLTQSMPEWRFVC